VEAQPPKNSHHTFILVVITFIQIQSLKAENTFLLIDTRKVAVKELQNLPFQYIAKLVSNRLVQDPCEWTYVMDDRFFSISFPIDGLPTAGTHHHPVLLVDFDKFNPFLKLQHDQTLFFKTKIKI
jgi:hypothetical protein